MAANGYDKNGPVTWFITVGKIPGWSYERFVHEYTKVHAEMTKQVAEHTGNLKDYAQVLVDYDSQTEKPVRDAGDNEGWEALTIHIWSSLHDIFAGFADPGYRANAGKHLFSNLDDMTGLFATNVGEVNAATSDGGMTMTKARTVIFHRKDSGEKGMGGEETLAWLKTRLPMGEEHVKQDRRVLRYRQYIDCTPRNVTQGVQGTLFAAGNWEQFCAVEEFLFNSTEEASEYVNQNRLWIEAGGKPLIITGLAYKVVGSD